MDDFGQVVEWDVIVQVVDVMEVDVGVELLYDWVYVYVVGGFEGGFFVGLVVVVVEGDFGEIMLGVEQVGVDCVGDEVGDGLCEQESCLVVVDYECGVDCEVDDQCDKVVEVFVWVVEKWIQVYVEQKYEYVVKEDCEWMVDEQVVEVFVGGVLLELVFGYDWE